MPSLSISPITNDETSAADETVPIAIILAKFKLPLLLVLRITKMEFQKELTIAKSSLPSPSKSPMDNSLIPLILSLSGLMKKSTFAAKLSKPLLLVLRKIEILS